MNRPLVSVIIPVYNAEKYVAETVTSALNQTWVNKEIIIIDDGSTDNSLNIIKGFNDGRIKILTQENKGASIARNYGLKEARGEYIQFLDADDLLSANKIEVQMKALSGFPEHIGLCGTIHFQDGDDPFASAIEHEWMAAGSDDPLDFLIKLYGGNLIGPQYGGMIQPNAWLTPRLLIDKAGFWNEMRNPDDDGEFFCRVVLVSKGIIYLPAAINYYRKFNTSNSLSAKKTREAMMNILKSTDLKTSHMLSQSNSKTLKVVLSRLYHENAFNFYPDYMDLVFEAEKKGKELAPHFKNNPYNQGVTFKLATLTSWKTVRFLQHLKNKILKK